MRESGYYPPGAEFDPNAPYNQVDPPEIECYDCEGTGQDEYGDDCPECDGTGYREMTADEMDEEGQNRLAEMEEAAERKNEERLGRD